MQAFLTKTKAFIAAHDRELSAAALCTGFIVDTLTLKRIDLLFENLVVLTYLFVAALCIVVLDLRSTRAFAHRVGLWAVTVAPFVMQIAFGALFSAFVVFYFRSASLSASWPFLLFLLAMLIGNESFRRHYHEQLPFRIAIFFVALTSYCIFAVPTVVGTIGPLTFVGSVLLALGIMAILIRGLARIPGNHVRASLPIIRGIIGGIVAILAVAYITNVIPPIPLALKDVAVAHQVERVGNEYKLILEPRTIFDQLLLRDVFHKTAGESVSVWTSVFAPTDLTTTIVHVWQRKVDGDWVTEGRIPFVIRGGADGGYRGYSTKGQVAPGKWRVSVETERGQVIGRVRFNVIDVAEPEELKMLTR